MNEHKQKLKNEIQKVLEEYASNHAIKARAFRLAKIKTRADGTDFAKLTNTCCENCEITYEGIYYRDTERPKVQVRYENGRGRYETDDLPCYGSIDPQYPHITKQGETYANTPNSSHEINTRMKLQADKYDRYREECFEQIDKLDLAFNDFYDAVFNAYAKLFKLAGESTSLTYACIDKVIKDTYGMQYAVKNGGAK